MPIRKIYIKNISSKLDFKLPNYESKGAAGMDLSADIDSDIIIKPYDRIAQIIISQFVKAEFEIAENLDETDRGNSGFGSTGK